MPARRSGLRRKSSLRVAPSAAARAEGAAQPVGQGRCCRRCCRCRRLRHLHLRLRRHRRRHHRHRRRCRRRSRAGEASSSSAARLRRSAANTILRVLEMIGRKLRGQILMAVAWRSGGGRVAVTGVLKDGEREVGDGALLERCSGADHHLARREKQSQIRSNQEQPEAAGSNQKHPEARGSNRTQCEAIKSTQKREEAIGHNAKQSGASRRNNTQSMPLRSHRWQTKPSVANRGHRRRTRAIVGKQEPSGAPRRGAHASPGANQKQS